MTRQRFRHMLLSSPDEFSKQVLIEAHVGHQLIYLPLPTVSDGYIFQ